MPRWLGVQLVFWGLVGCVPRPTASTEPRPTPEAHESLAPVESFAGVQDPAARSAVMFLEVSRVFTHPRCANCHPDGDHPRQGRAMVLHEPPVERGPDSQGIPGAECTTCHQDHNQPQTRVPGAPNWHLAPIEAAWLGKSAKAICEQLKDPARNGGRDLEAIHEHMAHDALVGWAWAPGADRAPAPGSQADAAALVRAWIDSGAHCPQETR